MSPEKKKNPRVQQDEGSECERVAAESPGKQDPERQVEEDEGAVQEATESNIPK